MRTVIEEYGSFIIECLMGAVIIGVLVVCLSAMSTLGNQAASVEVGAQVSDEYMEVPYIESTGTQYIDTGYALTSDSAEIYIDFTLTDTDANQMLFGAKQNGSPAYTGMLQTVGDGDLAFSCGDTKLVENYEVTSEKSYTFSVDVDSSSTCKTRMGTATVNSTYTGGLNKASSIILFAGGVNDVPSNFAKMKLHRFQVYQDEGIVRDLVPVVRLSDKKPGLYDRVNNRFYTNSGSGEFEVNLGFTF